MLSMILRDRWGEFENDLFKELAKLFELKKLKTTPYLFQATGEVERIKPGNKIFMLRTLPDLHENKWNYYVKKLVFTCNVFYVQVFYIRV